MATTADRILAPSDARSHRYYLAMALGLTVLVIVAFSRSYYLRSIGDARMIGMPPLTPLAGVHGVVFLAWFLLLTAQASLIGAGRPDLHRRLGIAATVLVPLLVVVGLSTAINAASAGWNPLGISTPLRFLALGIGGVLLFGAFATAALAYRRAPEVHKRLVILATLNLMWAPITRLPFVAAVGTPAVPLIAALFLSFLLLALSGPLYDFATGRRVRPLEVAAGVLTVAEVPLARWFGGTAAWQTFGGWLIGQ